MIDEIEIKIEILRLQECSLKNRSFWKLVISLETYMKWRRQLQDYDISKTTSFLKIMQFGFEILWIYSQRTVQWNYVMSFHIRGSFLTTFCTSFCKRVHNSKGLFVLTVGYVDIKTQCTMYQIYYMYCIILNVILYLCVFQR